MGAELLCRDCLYALAEIPDNCVDLTVTSPPYDNLRTYNGNIAAWDFEKFKAVAEELYRVTKPGGTVVWIVSDSTIGGSESGNSFRQAIRFMEVGFLLNDTMIWEKMSNFQHKCRYINSFEYMFVLTKGKPKTVNLITDRENKYAGTRVHGTERQPDGSLRHLSDIQMAKTVKPYGARTNVWRIPSVKGSHEHPAQFPEQLAHDHILSWSNPGDTVLDPMMGSGTTGVAAIRSGRNFIGIEIDENYFRMAEQRIQEAL